MNEYFSNRVTVRDFSPTPLPEGMIEKVIELAMRAPTCGNMQLYSVIVTRDPLSRKALATQHFNQPASSSAPVILTVCADFNRFSRWCELSGATPGYRNFHSFICALTDAVIFTQQIATIAEMEGLGTCYLGTVNYNASEISEMLSLPELVVPVACLAIGYPASKPGLCERLPLKAVMHEEKYRDDSDSDIMELFRVKDEFPENKEFVKLNNKDSLASIFTDIRYPLEMNETVSKSFFNLLKNKGFIE